MGKSGVLEHKSDNISETCQGRGKVTMEGLWELISALSNGTIPDPVCPLLPQDWEFATPSKTPIAIILGIDEATNLKCGRRSHRVHRNKSPLNI